LVHQQGTEEVPIRLLSHSKGNVSTLETLSQGNDDGDTKPDRSHISADESKNVSGVGPIPLEQKESVQQQTSGEVGALRLDVHRSVCTGQEFTERKQDSDEEMDAILPEISNGDDVKCDDDQMEINLRSNGRIICNNVHQDVDVFSAGFIAIGNLEETLADCPDWLD